MGDDTIFNFYIAWHDRNMNYKINNGKIALLIKNMALALVLALAMAMVLAMALAMAMTMTMANTTLHVR